MTPHSDTPQRAEVLLVEDNLPDARLILDILQQGPVAKNVRVVDGGDAALAFLRRTGPYAESPRPDLVVLDLNLPGRDGRDVLREIKNDPSLCCIPVVILTTSSAPTDVRHAYDLHANAYIVKPLGLDAFTDVIRGVEAFWLAMAQLPGPA
jgi:CheY-like chemotaxis protein